MKNLCVCITEAFASITVCNRKLSFLICLVIVSLFLSNSVLSLSCPSAHSLRLFISELSLSLSLSCSQHCLSPLSLDSSLKQQEEQTEAVFLRFASFSSLRAIRRRDSVECCIIWPRLVLFGCNIKIKIMLGNINGSQLDCSTRGDRLGLLSLQFCVLIYRLSLQRLPCGNIRQNDAGFVYSTALSDCCSSFCLNTNGNKMRRSRCLIMLLFLSPSHSSQRTGP